MPRIWNIELTFFFKRETQKMNPEQLEMLAELRRQFLSVTSAVEAKKNTFSFDSKMQAVNIVYTIATAQPPVVTTNQFVYHEALYLEYQALVHAYVANSASTMPVGEMQVFHAIVRKWEDFKVVKRWLQRVFDYISRAYVTTNKVPSFDVVALHVFRVQLLQGHAQTIVKCILELISRERAGELVPRHPLRFAIEMLMSVRAEDGSMYRSLFLDPFLGATQDYFDSIATSWQLQYNAKEYLHIVETTLQDELQRCSMYFSLRSTEDRVMSLIERIILGSKSAKNLLIFGADGFRRALTEGDTQLVQRFYNLYARHYSSAVVDLAEVLRETVLREGEERTKKHSGPEAQFECGSCVMEFIELEEKYVTMVAQNFRSHHRCVKAVRDALEKSLATGISLVDAANRAVAIPFGELLATFCDSVIRQQEKMCGSENVEQTLDRIIDILSFLPDKDHFLHHAKELFCRRLLSVLGRPSDELEVSFLSRLKLKCGAAITGSIESMLADKMSSAESDVKFKLFCSSHAISLPCEVNVSVLKTGIWPAVSVEPITIPEEIRLCLSTYTTFFDSFALRKRLTWSHMSSSAHVEGSFEKTKKMILVQGHQACVLEVFNHALDWSVKELEDKTRIPHDELMKVIIAFLRHKILVRERAERSPFAQSERIRCNTSFSSPTRKVYVPLMPLKVSVATTLRNLSVVEEDRKPLIDASLVRILKSRKQLSHTELVNIATEQLSAKFKIDSRSIKMRIEELLRREYLERLPEDPSIYRYVA